MHGCFPLTPTLSLGERENPSQRVDKSSAAIALENSEMVAPAPKGEKAG